MKSIFNIVSIVAFVSLSSTQAIAQVKKQITESDKTAIENVIVEKYYTAKPSDYKDTVGGTLPAGSVTYRIYIDLKPEYSLLAVYGVQGHELKIETTTQFFNTTAGGEKTGDKIELKRINENNVALDSWATIGAAADSCNGISLTDDKDGSILNKPSFNKTDGLVKGLTHPINFYGTDLSFFQDVKSPSSFVTDNASWAVFGGVKNPNPQNKILIAQLTTNGKLSLELNIMVGTPNGASVFFVAKNPVDAEVQFNGLIFKY